MILNRLVLHHVVKYCVSPFTSWEGRLYAMASDHALLGLYPPGSIMCPIPQGRMEVQPDWHAGETRPGHFQLACQAIGRDLIFDAPFDKLHVNYRCTVHTDCRESHELSLACQAEVASISRWLWARLWWGVELEVNEADLELIEPLLTPLVAESRWSMESLKVTSRVPVSTLIASPLDFRAETSYAYLLPTNRVWV